MIAAADGDARGEIAQRRPTASAKEVIDAVEPSKAYDDQIDRNDEIQQPRHDQYQYAGNERNERRDVGNRQRHGDLLGLG
jgi:hypothetical protein